ncbi:MAG: hypothetical protein COX02_01630 [Candidatus Vogelbacteria bacterium CG22_combo_CG10-13_8_21_14_all_37_9]|uniref:NAD(+) kinase n=1 Tax=Candidatus Vogelbacteria bacterium CG22_combo_CG10-13_8_21_14_all_37_9 TaxID=1975046 RepID=A0A2H0BMH3_9BACT|nr:MAG: hypothetical protein BK005_00545 [bacterium CG10_37_50]PIP58188.1 MAG: hypothetical protein COX02_01630 [Candidatus Vogelbacteria bacterium CG22_combo_CG10-13_8_21_14_all_37_9]
MKALIFSDKINDIKALVLKAGFDLVEKDPDIIISYGGDGTFFQSEYHYPEIPKLILKSSRICKLCFQLSNEELLTRVMKGDYKIKTIPKLEAQVGTKTLLALNDIIVHNANPRHAIRYQLSLDGQAISPNEIIGDGVIIATPLGSTGYYRSITDSYFELGLGIAFNNSTEQADHLVVAENRQIAITIFRGPVTVFADNQEKTIELAEGEIIKIQQVAKVAKLITF